MITSTEIGDSIWQHDVPLRNYTSFRTGGVAEIFAEPRSISELKKVLQFCKREQKKIFVLGNGSNVLVNDNGVQGVVVYMGGAHFKQIKRNGMYICSGAGTGLSELMRKAATWGLGGLGALVGIPGTVGGAVVMNAGGKYGNISDSIASVTTMAFNGEIKNHNREDIDFWYRGCGLHKQIVIEVTFLLKEAEKEKVFGEMDKIFQEKKESQPLATLNAGCIFKNTQGFKAAELIDRANLKGMKVGGAAVSSIHANFIVNTENATSCDILGLIKVIKNTVKKKYNITLETELQIW